MKLEKKELDEKYNKCELPCEYESDDNFFTYIRYDKLQDEYYNNNSIYEMFSDMIERGLIYHYSIKEENEVSAAHGHSFDDVIRALYLYPESFSIPEDREFEYSKQELMFLKRLQNYLLLIKLKDIKEFEDIKLNREKSKVKDYTNMKFVVHDEEHIKNIIDKKKDYFIRLSFGFDTDLDKRYIIVDKEENFRLVLKINKSDIIKVKDLKEDMLYLNGMSLEEFKNDFINHYKEMFNTTEFNEDTDIVYSKFEIEKIY